MPEPSHDLPDDQLVRRLAAAIREVVADPAIASAAAPTALGASAVATAQGILMERFDLTSDRALAVLERASLGHRADVADVAATLVARRDDPDLLDGRAHG